MASAHRKETTAPAALDAKADAIDEHLVRHALIMGSPERTLGHAAASSSTASITALTRSGEISTP